MLSFVILVRTSGCVYIMCNGSSCVTCFRWTFNPVLLKKSVGESLPPLTLVPTEEFQVGDFVKISNDQERVCKLQDGHGEWVDSMVQVSLYN